MSEAGAQLGVLPGGGNLKYWVVGSLGHWRQALKGSGDPLFMRGIYLLCVPAIKHHPTVLQQWATTSRANTERAFFLTSWCLCCLLDGWLVTSQLDGVSMISPLLFLSLPLVLDSVRQV